MAIKHLLKHSSGHLLKHASGHLSITKPTWHDVIETFTNRLSASTQALAYTRSNVNTTATAIYATVRATVLSGMLTDTASAITLVAGVGGAFNVPGAPKANLWAGCRICEFTKPTQTISGARVYSSSFYNYGGTGGLFTSLPSGSTLMSGTLRSPSSNYITFTSDEVKSINNAATGATLYFVLGVAPPASADITYTDRSLQNEKDEAAEYYGFTLSPGEYLYWKTGNMDFPTQTMPQMSDLQFLY